MRLLTERVERHLEDAGEVNCTCVCDYKSGLNPEVNDAAGQCFHSPKESYAQKVIWRMLLAR